MPSPDQLARRMVPLEQVQALDDLRGRTVHWTSVASFFITIPVGIAINVITDDHLKLSEVAAIVAAVTGTVALVATGIALSANRQAKRAREHLLA